jgi:hypothetical protein
MQPVLSEPIMSKPVGQDTLGKKPGKKAEKTIEIAAPEDPLASLAPPVSPAEPAVLSQVAAPEPAISPVVPVPEKVLAVEPSMPVPAPVSLAPAPQAEYLSTPASTTNYNVGNAKIYLGTFSSEATARQQWIKTWTGNSAALGNLIAGIEQADGGFALYGVGAESADTARSICDKLRANGVSCGS